jgi:thiamine biosynthesis lipoprotein
MKRLKAVHPVLVSAGGDLAVSGPRADGEPWPISVDDPFHPGGHVEMLYLETGAVATSGKDRRRWTMGNRPMHHVIDPRTSFPAETDVLTATVIAPSTVQAEASAKAAMILSSREGMAWLEARPELAGLLILESGELLYSNNLGDYI